MRISIEKLLGLLLLFVLVAVFVVAVAISSSHKKEPLPETRPLLPQSRILKTAKITAANIFDKKIISAIDINNPRSCKPCHRAIFEEWDDSYHRFSREDGLYKTFSLTQGVNPGAPVCQTCHLPQSVLEVAPLDPPKSRRKDKHPRIQDGVDCAACHRRFHQIVGKKAVKNACKAVGDKFFGTAEFCGGCHRSYLKGTKHEYDEWKENPKPISEKKTCIDCHMPLIEGNSIGGAGKHRDHHFYGGHNIAMLKKAFKVRIDFRRYKNADYIVVMIYNQGTGHQFPTGYAIRRVNIFVSAEDKQGVFVGGGDIDMCKPPRYSGLPGTQVSDKGKREFFFRIDFPEDGGKAHIKIIYKLYPAASDDESYLLYEKDFKLPPMKKQR